MLTDCNALDVTGSRSNSTGFGLNAIKINPAPGRRENNDFGREPREVPGAQSHGRALSSVADQGCVRPLVPARTSFTCSGVIGSAWLPQAFRM